MLAAIARISPARFRSFGNAAVVLFPHLSSYANTPGSHPAAEEAFALPHGLPPPTRTTIAVYKRKDLTEDYDVHEVLGKGQYGVCRRACSRATRAEVAVKSISKLKIRTDKDKQEVEQEIAIMRHLAGHPNVVRLFDVYEDAGHIHLVMELCKGGELFDQIIKKGYYR